ncbi:MAG: SDR family oxidoreductase [Dehalococcoidia bacterium]|nr:SDR family oxidoreductase [Dehalococcoidia bacterium]
MELRGKTAIVTGSSRGIGKSYAIALAQAGASVVLAARTQKHAVTPPRPVTPGQRQVSGQLPGSLDETAAEIISAGGTAVPISCDVTQENSVQALVATTIARFGKIDILVNNAAVFPRGHYLEETPERFDTLFHINVLGYYLTCKHVLPHMIKQRSGSIINLSSTGTLMGGSGKGNAVSKDLLYYHMSKAAINRMTTFLADEVSEYGIAVNALTPGGNKTPGMDDAMGADFDYAADRRPLPPPTPERLGPPLIWLAQQTAATYTGKIVTTPDFRKTWP